MNTQQKHAEYIKLGPGCYFLIMIWIHILEAAQVDVKTLANATAISAPTIRKYLSKLQAFGYALPVGQRWMLMGFDGQYELFGIHKSIPQVIDGDLVDVDKIPEIVDKSQNVVDKKKKNFFPPINIIKENSLIKQELNNTNSSGKNFFPGQTQKDLQQETPIDPMLEQHAEVVNALLDVGIQMNVRTKRLLGRIEPQDIRQEYNKLRDYGQHKETGLLITILEGKANLKDRINPSQDYSKWNE
jgi:hypothetical protein